MNIGLANVARQNERDPSPTRLLVLFHEFRKLRRLIRSARHVGKRDRQARRPYHPGHFFRNRSRRNPFGRAIAEGQHHAQRNGLAMQHVRAVTVGRFNSMAERMAKIQQGAHAALGFVLCHDRRLGPA